jgi:sugar lactone lactonase YvrE
MPEPRVLLSGLAIGESPRWHEGRLWLCNWCTQEIVAVDLDGTKEVIAHVPTTFPFSIDWLPGGPLLVVSGREALVQRIEPDGSLATHADLSDIGPVFNEIVVDGRGNTYVNGADLVALIPATGAPRLVADGLAFGNGMAVTPDNSTLIVAESHANQLTAFDIAPGSGVVRRRTQQAMREGRRRRYRPGNRRGRSRLLRLHARRRGRQDPLRGRGRMARHGSDR